MSAAAGRDGTRFADARATWDARYSREDYILGTAPNRFLAAQSARLAPGQRALCVADGEGRNGVWLAEQGLHVSAFDISPVGVEKSRQLAARRNVTVDFEVNDVHGYAWPPVAFDVIAAIFVQFADPATRTFMFERMVTSLKPGGWLLVEGYTPGQLEYKTGGPPQVEHLYTAELLRGAFGALDIVELREYDAELVEGTQHVGLSALIDLVARKR
jgi:SAM-dependent methyltransferase